MQFADRVHQTTTTTGTGAYSIGSLAVAGYTTFADSFTDGDQVPYCVTDGTAFEVGIGIYTVLDNSLSRDTILRSSNGDAAIDWDSGSRSIFCTLPARVLPTYGTNDPTIDINPPFVGAERINISTGERWTCIDNSPDSNIWRGTAGRIVDNLPRTGLVFEWGKVLPTVLCDATGGTVPGMLEQPVPVTTTHGIGLSFSRAKDDHIAISPPIPPTDEFTISAWVNLVSLAASGAGSASRRGIFYEGTSNHKVGLSVYDDGCVLFGVYLGAYYEIFYTASKLQVGQDYHLVGMRDGGNLYLFINGTQVASRTCPTTKFSSFGASYIGWQYAGRGMDGVIAALRIYNIALLAEEIAALSSE